MDYLNIVNIHHKQRNMEKMIQIPSQKTLPSDDAFVLFGVGSVGRFGDESFEEAVIFIVSLL